MTTRIRRVLLLPLFMLGVSCSPGDGAEGRSMAASEGDDRSTPVAAAEAQRRDLARTVTVSGPVEPIRNVLVNAQMAGNVLSVRVEEGDRVRSGQLMAELDARETAAQLERARAALANAEAAYRRSEQLAGGGLVTQAALDAARSAYEIARADVKLWETRLAFSRIAAPVSGIVTAKRVERGGAVGPNQTLFEIAEDRQLVVRVRVSELDVVHLSTGDAVRVRVDAYPEASIPGRVRRIFPSADPASRLVPVEVVLGSRPPELEVRPGFLARVEFAFERRADAVAIPALAVGVSQDGSYVYVIQADTLVRRSIRTGLTTGGWVEVTDGLEPGERVVSSGHVNLRPGMRVRVTQSAVAESKTDR